MIGDLLELLCRQLACDGVSDVRFERNSSCSVHGDDSGWFKSWQREYMVFCLCGYIDKGNGVLECVFDSSCPVHGSPIRLEKIKSCDYKFCPYCLGSFSFTKCNDDFTCPWCKKDVRNYEYDKD